MLLPAHFAASPASVPVAAPAIAPLQGLLLEELSREDVVLSEFVIINYLLFIVDNNI
jgi:hypothetical protein